MLQQHLVAQSGNDLLRGRPWQFPFKLFSVGRQLLMQSRVQSLQCGIYLVVIGIEQVEGTLWYYLTPQHLFTYYSHGIDIYTSDPKFPPFQDSS